MRPSRAKIEAAGHLKHTCPGKCPTAVIPCWAFTRRLPASEPPLWSLSEPDMVRLPQRKSMERDGKRPKMGLSAAMRGSATPAFCAIPAVARVPKKQYRPKGQTGGPIRIGELWPSALLVSLNHIGTLCSRPRPFRKLFDECPSRVIGVVRQEIARARSRRFDGPGQGAGLEFLRDENVVNDGDALSGDHGFDCVKLLPKAQLLNSARSGTAGLRDRARRATTARSPGGTWLATSSSGSACAAVDR